MIGGPRAIRAIRRVPGCAAASATNGCLSTPISMGTCQPVPVSMQSPATREFGAEFVNRHWNQLLWATDCHCLDGKGNWESVTSRPCFASQTLPLLKEYCDSEEKYHAITQGNAERVLGL